jgi:hypothetical protein
MPRSTVSSNRPVEALLTALEDELRRPVAMVSKKDPDLAAFEDGLTRSLNTKPRGPRKVRGWRMALDEWIVAQRYVRQRTLREASRYCPRDARTAEEVAEETRGRLWEGLSRAAKPALGWDGRDSGFWPTVIWRQTMKTLRENDPYWAQGHMIANSEVVQAIVDNDSCAESADARLLGHLWHQAVERKIRRLIRKLKGRPRDLAYRVVVRNLGTRSVAYQFGIDHETALDHWRQACDLLAKEVDLRALANEYDVELPAEFTDAYIIDLLYRKSL